jgi:predicted nucleic acid-binding protein
MPELSVVADTSPLLYLHLTGHLSILHELYGTVIVPVAVERELEVGHRQGFDVPSITGIHWIDIQQASSTQLRPAVVDLGPGETEVIALGLELPDSLLIIDDNLARQISEMLGLKRTGTLGVLIRAKNSGLIQSLAPIIASLKEKGMWLSEEVAAAAMRLAGE